MKVWKVAEAGHNRFAVTWPNDFTNLHVYAGKCTVMLTALDSMWSTLGKRMFEPHTTHLYAMPTMG